ncbi:DUF5753 domain-containing protein [Streptosporangium sp. NPDC002607]
MLDAESAPSIEIVLDEAVLHRMIGGPKVMRAQLEHLAKSMSRPNVTVRVLPFATGAHASPEGAFTIFDMPEPYSDASYVETRGGAVYTEAEGAEIFARAYDSLRSTAGKRARPPAGVHDRAPAVLVCQWRRHLCRARGRDGRQAPADSPVGVA